MPKWMIYTMEIGGGVLSLFSGLLLFLALKRADLSAEIETAAMSVLPILIGIGVAYLIFGLAVGKREKKKAFYSSV